MKCPKCGCEMQIKSENRGVPPDGYFGETEAEYGANQENNLRLFY
jgi:hypothetical protein